MAAQASSLSHGVAEDISSAIAQALKRRPTADLQQQQVRPRSAAGSAAAAGPSPGTRMPAAFHRSVSSKGYCTAFLRQGLGYSTSACSKPQCPYRHEVPGAQLLSEHSLVWKGDPN